MAGPTPSDPRSPNPSVTSDPPLLDLDEAPADGPAEDEPAPEEPAGRVLGLRISTWVTLLVVGGAVLYTFLQLQPRLIFTDTTPAGGDMGAHVWAPAFLRDELLPSFRLTGWTPDWYAGFPALHFYMVPPMLAIVLLDVVLPYGVAFKLVAVSGVVAMPAAAWAFGRLAGFGHPVPELLAVGTVGFLFDRTFTILGGNIASTLAGEFAFSISLSLAIVYLGLVANGLRTGRYRALAAAVVGLVALTHVIPLFFAIAGTFVLLAFYPSMASVRWIATSAPVGALLAMWWLLPFWWQRTFMNDMGWEKAIPPPDAGVMEEFGFWATRLFPQETRWVAYVAAVGVVVAVARRSMPALFLVAMAVVAAVGFVVAPQGRLWNERLLPFFHLCTYLLAAFGVAELVRWVAEAARSRSRDLVRSAGAAVLGVIGLSLVAFPVSGLPFTEERNGVYRWPVPPLIGTAWPLAVETTDRSFVPGWAEWNFTGYERKEAWPEFEDLLLTMGAVGEEHGCGRAMWEYEREVLGRYGTPMAPMLLPMFTDGCIGSMEGLYFESSVTTPYHFLAQSSVSESPSRAQRQMPYSDFDLGLGVQQMQLLGVSYYLTLSDLATNAAIGHPDLSEIARSGPWVIFEVADSPLVEPVAHEPIVRHDVHDAMHEWVPSTADWFQNPGGWDPLWASDGPEAWQRVADPALAERRRVVPVEVTDIESGTDWVRFEVSEPGTPVLVKVSYFPNWRATGAEGPWRVTPNFMVVIPTETTVELNYGRHPVDFAGFGLTAVGLVLLVLLARSAPMVMPVWNRPDGQHEEAWSPPAADERLEPAGPEPDGFEPVGPEPDDPERRAE